MYYLNIDFSAICGVVLSKTGELTDLLGELGIDWSMILKRILVGQGFSWPRMGLAFISTALNFDLYKSVDEPSNCKLFHNSFHGVSVFICGNFSHFFCSTINYGDCLILTS
jgi:hypothetical protein